MCPTAATGSSSYVEGMIRPPVFALSLSLFPPGGVRIFRRCESKQGAQKKFGRYLCKRWIYNPPWTPCNLQVVSDLRKGREKKNLLDIPHLAIPYLFRAFPRDYMTFSEMEENPALSLPGNFAVACPPSLPPMHTKPFLGFAQPVRTCLPTYNFFPLA